MRVNVYDHELTDRVEVATAHADNTGQDFFGVRIYIGPVIMHEPGDDDSSAVTYWIPWSRRAGHDLTLLRSAFTKALATLDLIEAQIAFEAANRHRASLEGVQNTQAMEMPRTPEILT